MKKIKIYNPFILLILRKFIKIFNQENKEMEILIIYVSS